MLNLNEFGGLFCIFGESTFVKSVFTMCGKLVLSLGGADFALRVRLTKCFEYCTASHPSPSHQREASRLRNAGFAKLFTALRDPKVTAFDQISHLPQVEVVEGHLRLRVNVLQVPAEALALEAFAKLLARAEIADVDVAGAFKRVHERHVEGEEEDAAATVQGDTLKWAHFAPPPPNVSQTCIIFGFPWT